MRVPRMKTLVPDLPSHFVSRPRLLDVLDDRPAGVMLVCAPPGYGKTLLLVDWVHRAGAATTAWVNLDRDDNDVERLCAAIAAALARCAAVPADSPVHQLATSRTGARHEFLADLIDALDGLPVPLQLVLDDVQEIVGRDALRTLQQLLRHLPAGVRLVLLSRVDPPLALMRLRLEGRLAELRAEHLRFTRPETADLLALSGPALAPDQVGMLHEATDGWPAGLRLAVSSLAAAADPDQFLDEFSGDERSVADYLVDEVLQSMPADTRELLSLVSVCDPIPADLAAELSGRHDAARELNALQHDSALVTRGPPPSEYRIHVLLRSYLRADLARHRPTLILQLNARAARWWAARDRPVEALQQAMNGVQPLVLTDLLRRFVLPLLLTGEHATLRRALSSLGEAAAADPLLAAAQAALPTASTDGAPNAGGPHQPVEGVAADANSSDSASMHRRRAHPAWAGPGAVELQALRTVAGSVEAGGGVAEDGDVAGGGRSVPPDNRSWQAARTALDAFVRGVDLLRRQGDVRSGLQLLTVALDLARPHGFDYLAMQCEALMAAGAAGLHDCDAMVKAGDQALAMADEHGWQRTPWSTTAQAVLAYGALLRAEPDEAYRLASQALRGARVLDRELEFGLRSLLGAATFDRGQHAAGLQQMQHARADFGEHHLPPVQAAAIAVLEYRAAVFGGHPAAARTVLHWLTDRAGQCGETQLMRSWEEVRAGRRTAARLALHPLLDGATPPLLPSSVVEGRLVEAQLDLLVGDRASARRALRRALSAAGPLGVLRPFITAGAAVRELLVHQMGSFGDAELVAEATLGALRRTQDPAAARLLSAREIEVLTLLPTLLSLEEIADELEITINTVKSHSRAIYTKLGVGSRRGAVVAAHERGLLHRPPRHRRHQL